jgi:hypothetical protein
MQALDFKGLHGSKVRAIITDEIRLCPRFDLLPNYNSLEDFAPILHR